MHIKLVLKETAVERNRLNKALLDIYQNARKRSGAPEDKKPDADRAIRLPGYLPRIKEIIEDTTFFVVGAKITIFDSTQILLDPAAEILLSEYLNFLNTLVIKAGCGPVDTENETLSKPEVVVRAILYRLAAELLGIVEEDKNKLLTAISLFIEDVAKQSTFTEKKYKFFGNEVASDFLNTLINESKNTWFPAFSNAIRGMGILNLNHTAISNVISDIRMIAFDVKAHLCAYFNPDQPYQNLMSNDWLDSLLMQHETRYETHAKRIDVGYSEERIIYQDKVLSRIYENKNKEVGDKMAELYTLLVRITALQDLLILTSQFIEGTGWIAILRNIFDFHALAKLIKQYYDMRDRAIITLKQLDKTSANLGLGRRIRFIQASIEMTSLSALKMLDNEDLKRHIRATLFSNARQLVAFQNSFCSPELRFVSESIVNELGMLLSPSKYAIAKDADDDMQYLREQAKFKDVALQSMAGQAQASSSVAVLVSASYVANSQIIDINYLCLAAQNDSKASIFSTVPVGALDNHASDTKYIGARLSSFVGKSTPLVVAVASGNRNVINELIKKQVNPFIACGGFDSWIASEILTHNVISAAVNKPEEIIQQLKAYEAKYAKDFAKLDSTQIVRPTVGDACRAVYSKNLNWVTTLIKQRCNFNGTAVSYGRSLAGLDRILGGKDRTPLALAAEEGNKDGFEDIVLALVEVEDPSMVDPHIKCGSEGLTALDYAKLSKNDEIIGLIETYIVKYDKYKQALKISV